MANWSGLSPSASSGRMPPPTFRTVFRGYDPDEVLKYLSRVADHVESLEADSRRFGRAKYGEFAGHVLRSQGSFQPNSRARGGQGIPGTGVTR